MQRLSHWTNFGARVMSGDNAIKAHRLCAIQDCSKFNFLIAAQARIRSAAGRVFRKKVFYDAIVKFFGHIPDVERNTDFIGGTTRIVRIFNGATTARTRTIFLWVRCKGKVNTNYFVTGFNSAGSSNCGINSPAHGSDNFHF